MDKKKIEKLVSSEKVSVADDFVVSAHIELIKDLLGFFNYGLSPMSFHSDESNLANVLGLVHDGGIVTAKHKKYIITRLNEFLETPLKEEDLYVKLKTILPTIKIKPHNPDNHPLRKFLGIKQLKDNHGEDWSLEYFIGQKTQVDYFEGFIYGKEKPLNGDKEMVDSIMKDHMEAKRRVYGQELGVHYVVITVEKEELIFKNIYELSCWLTARASNYVEGKKESW